MAVDDDYIRSNPSDNVLKELKQSHCFQTEKRRGLTVPEQELFLEFLQNSYTYSRWYPLFAVMIRKGYAYIKEHINWSVQSGEGTSRVEVPEIPVEAIREIVVNSFAHADYRGISENEIVITPTRVEIYNPGTFPSGLSPEMFARQRIRSMPRNKVILSTLYKSKDVELFGSGFRKVYALCDKYSIRVEATYENDGFSFSFYRDTLQGHVTENVPANDTENVSEKTAATKTSTDMKVYVLLKEDPAQTREMLAEKTGRTVRTIQRALDKLSGEGKIRRIGSSKTGYWEVF